MLALQFLVLTLTNHLPSCESINTESIRLATEYQVKRARDYIQDNYESIITQGENYWGCTVYDMCTNPPSLFTDSDTIIDPWYQNGTAWHFPLCNESETLIGVRPNNHNQETGELLTENSCPEYDIYIGCDYDNSLIKPGIKIPSDANISSQDFLDATCFTHELEDIWTTRIYSNCHTDLECFEMAGINVDNIDTDEYNISCLSYGICSNTETIEIDSFEPYYVEYQYFGDQRTGILSQIPALYWDALDTGSCPGSYDPRFRPWYECCACV